jgi:hypothetical protein
MQQYVSLSRGLQVAAVVLSSGNMRYGLKRGGRGRGEKPAVFQFGFAVDCGQECGYLSVFPDDAGVTGFDVSENL